MGIGQIHATISGRRRRRALWFGPMIEILANAYMSGRACEPTVRELQTLTDWIDAEFFAIPCQVQFWTGEISLAECKDSFVQSGIINISTAYNSHPFLSNRQNAKFRAVHDWAHIVLGADDSFAGEFETWKHNEAPDSIQWLLFSEIVLQAAACLHTGEFQPQKFVKMPSF